MNDKINAPDRYPPTMNLDDVDLPDIKDYKVGNIYNLTIKAKMISCNEDMGICTDGEKKKPKMSAGFRILKVEASEKNPKNYKEILEEEDDE